MASKGFNETGACIHAVEMGEQLPPAVQPGGPGWLMLAASPLRPPRSPRGRA